MSEFAAVKELLDTPTEPTEPNETNEIVEPTPAEGALPEDEAVTEEVTEETKATEATQAAPEGDDIQTIAQLAEAIEVDADYLYKIKVGMGDGADAIPLGELKDVYQESLRKTGELEQRIAQQQAEIEQAQNTAGQYNEMSEQHRKVDADRAALNQQYNQIDWAEFEQRDPGNAALARQKFQTAATELDQMQQQASYQEQQFSQQHLHAQALKMVDLVPEWKDPAARQTGQKEVAAFMQEAGYHPDQIDSMDDPIGISLVLELMQLRKEKAEATESLQIVRKAPKVLRGGGRTAPKTDNVKALRDKARATGNKNDELAAVKALLSNSR